MDSKFLFPIQNVILGHGIGFIILETVETMKEGLNQARFLEKTNFSKDLCQNAVHSLATSGAGKVETDWNDWMITQFATSNCNYLLCRGRWRTVEWRQHKLCLAVLVVEGQTYVSRVPDILKRAWNFKFVQLDTKSGQLFLYRYEHRMYWVHLGLGESAVWVEALSTWILSLIHISEPTRPY